MWEILHSKTAQAIGTWFGILSGVGAVLTWFTPEWFGRLSLPQAILLGIGLALAASLTISIAVAVFAFGFRLLKPLPVTTQAPARGGKMPATPLADNPKLSAQVEELSKKVKAVIQDYQTVLGRFAQVDDRFRAADVKMNTVEIDFADVRRGCAKLEEKVENNEKYVRESFYAIFARERMSELAREIESDADDLYLRLKSGENYTAQEWDQWVNVHHHWERTIKEWMDTARWYAKDVKNRVMNIDDREYDAQFGVLDSQFPNADAVRRFKRHRIIQSHWGDVRDDAKNGALKVAFHGGTEKEQHGGLFHQA